MKQARPKSILWFERLYFASLAVALLDYLVFWDMHIADFESDGELAGLGELFLVIMLMFTVILSMVLWYFVAIKAEQWAKWLQVILFSVGVIALIGELYLVLVPGSEEGTVIWDGWQNVEWPYYLSALYFISLLLGAASTYMLFRSDAVIWFETKGLKIDGIFD